MIKLGQTCLISHFQSHCAIITFLRSNNTSVQGFINIKNVSCQGQSLPLKSTSPLPSVSKMSITLWTRGFWCSSGRDMNSSILRAPELSRSSFLNLFPNRLISSMSTERKRWHNIRANQSEWNHIHTHS